VAWLDGCVALDDKRLVKTGADNRHATKHARATGHPVIASSERGERWLYCCPDDAFAEY